MRLKKITSLLMCGVLMLGLIGCGAGEGTASESDSAVQESEQESGQASEQGSETESGTINFDEDPYTIHVCYAVMGEAQPDLPLIQEKVNEITQKEINAVIEMEAVNLSSLANVYALKASSQEKVDLMILFPGFSYLTSFANSNLLMPVEDLVDQWGPNIKDVVGDMLPAGEYKGHLYAIPQNKGLRKNAYGFKISRALCEKHGIDAKAIKTIEDLEAAFAIIKEAEPEVTVVMAESLGTGITSGLMEYQDNLGIGSGVLSVEEDGSLKVVNSLESEKNMEISKKVREWYELGYISKDVLTVQDDGVSSLKAGKCFATASNSIEPGEGDADSWFITLNPEKPLVCTSDDQLIMWGIPSTCERPEKAVQFLDLCFGSKELVDLLQYGVEDVHYTVVSENVIDNSNNANWTNFWPMFGDNHKASVSIGTLTGLDGVSTLEEYQAQQAKWEVEMSPAYGFNFDPTNVKTEIAACDAVNAEYGIVLGSGTVDPEEEMPKYIQKLYDSGLQKVLDEKQRQLDEWLASK